MIVGVCNSYYRGEENAVGLLFRKSPYSSVVEHPLSKRKVGSSILPGGKFLAIVSHPIPLRVGRERAVLRGVFALLPLCHIALVHAHAHIAHSAQHC